MTDTQPKPTVAEHLGGHRYAHWKDSTREQPGGYGYCQCGQRIEYSHPQHQADMLAAAGLLATAEHDQEVRAAAYREWFLADPAAARGYWQVPCDDCSGSGWFPVPDGYDGDSSCVRCKGTGWSLVSMVDPGADVALAEHDAQVEERVLRRLIADAAGDDVVPLRLLRARADRIEKKGI